MNKIIFSFLTALFACSIVCAQNNNSPYSILGLGDLEKSSFDRTSGMGHCGLALSSNRFFYNANPASYAALDDKFFTAEMSARFKSVKYSGTPITSASSQSSDLQWKKIIIGIKAKPYWGSAMGLMPFSTVNYSFSSTKTLQGGGYTVPAYYDGNGSVNQFLWSNAIKLPFGFSVGLNSAYLFGQLTQSETIDAGISDSVLVTTRKILVGTAYFKPGFQYQKTVNPRVKICLGGTMALKTNINGNKQLLVTDGNTIVKNDKNYAAKDYVLPTDLAWGLALKIRDKYTWALDYTQQNWGNTNQRGFGYSLINSNRTGIGFEYAQKQHFREVTFERTWLQAGAFAGNSYLMVNGEQLKDYGITLGGGFNAIRSNLGLQIQLEIGRRGTTNKGLVQENYTQVSLIASYRDFWFVKAKQYD